MRIGNFIGVMGGVLALGFVGSMYTSYITLPRLAEKKLELDRGYNLQEADLNGNGIPEKFYNIDGNIAVIELDNKPLFSSLDTKLSEKKE